MAKKKSNALHAKKPFTAPLHSPNITRPHIENSHSLAKNAPTYSRRTLTCKYISVNPIIINQLITKNIVLPNSVNMAATRRSLYTNPLPCKHLETSLYGRTSMENSETKIPRCISCNGYQGGFYLCLVCPSISCSSHTHVHAQFEKAHDIGVDVGRLDLYCYSCSDQVYDPDFDKTVMSSKNVQGISTNTQKAEDVPRRSSVGPMAPFYVFPCEHAFHAQCLIAHVTRCTNETQVEYILDLQKQLTLLGEGGSNSMNGGITEDSITCMTPVDKLRSQLDNAVASECPFCGDLMICKISLPFILPEEAQEVKSWEIKPHNLGNQRNLSLPV